MINKSQCAFQFSVEKLARENAKLYFWTLTFIHVPLDDSYAMADWNTLHLRMLKHFKGIKGMRVAELHRSHGIHFHLILNRRIGLDKLRTLCFGSGHLVGNNRYLDFGRLSVSRCDAGVSTYLSKYLTKKYAAENCFGGRRWGTVGGFKGVRVRDIESFDDATRNKRKLFGKRKIYFATMIMIRHYSNLWGALKNWPAEHQALVMMQRRKGDYHMVKQLEDRANKKISSDIREMSRTSPGKPKFVGTFAEYQRSLASATIAKNSKEGLLGREEWDGETGFEPPFVEPVDENQPF